MNHHIAIYCRISISEDGKRESASIQSQEHRCRQAIDSRELKNREDNIKLYIDDGCSGKDTNRPAFQRLYSSIGRDEVSHLFVTEVSRISRKSADFHNFLEKMRAHNVKFVSLKECVDQTTPLGALQLGLASLFATYEREQLRERCTASARSRAERGLWCGSIPLGYRRGENPGELQ